MRSSRTPRKPLRLCALALLSVGLLFGAGAAQATATGTVVAWGCALAGFDFGQCSVPTGLPGVTAIAASDSHSLALKSDGTVVAWGCANANFGNKGQCDVPGGLSGVTAIAAGFSDSLALKGDGTVVAWGCAGGNRIWGQCNVPSGLSGVTAIAAGGYHSLALKDDGTVVAWGCGSGSDFGQCSVPVGLAGVTAIAASVAHSLALKGDGTVVAWGCGSSRIRRLRAVQRAERPLRRDRDRRRELSQPGLEERRHGRRLGLRRPRRDCGQCSVPGGLSA